MLVNLMAEMKRSGVRNCDLAQLIHTSERTIRNKNKGETAYTIAETMKIRDKFFPKLELEYLFENLDGDEPQAE